MKVWLEMCSLYNVQAGLYIIRYVWAACIPHCYIASRRSLEQRWAHNNMNFSILYSFIACFYTGLQHTVYTVFTNGLALTIFSL